MWKLRFDDKDGAIYTVIAKFSPSLLNHEKFVHGLGQLDVERVENQARIGNLLAAGLSMKFIAPTMERLRQLSLSQDLRIRTAAYREWVTRFGKESVDGDLAAEIATLLENEKHDSDVYSLEALSLLEDSEGVNDPRVVKNLSRSVKYEENLDIALGAAWILANSTEMSEPLHSLISQRLTSDQNDSPIRQKLLAHPQFKPRRELSCINIFGDPSI
jgi:hypothetical protein